MLLQVYIAVKRDFRYWKLGTF